MASDEQQPADLTCQVLVEVVTDYLEGAMSAVERAHFEAHIAECPPCLEYVEQIRRTVKLTGSINAAELSDAERERLVGLFRNWRASPSS
ncbi:MAG: zf-HC2 domain-containing protein [Oscillochloris sp.]|nr:zf-HC2 domain-containing protein [Oscillochloris sp.]